MLRGLFLAVLNLSLLGLPLMAALLLLRRLLRPGVPRQGIYCLWALVLLRLVLPAAVSSPFSFYNLLPEERIVRRGETASAVVVSDSDATVEFPVLVRERDDNPGIDAARAPSSPPPAPHAVVARRPVDLYTILATVWACGAGMLLAFGAFCYLLVIQKVRRESFPLELPGFRGPPGVRVVQSGLFHTPVVCGLLRPKIVLPMEMDTGDAAAMQSVLAHEQAHIRRLDNLWRLLASFAVYLHWFNPLAWVCYCAFIRDMEVSCDERVLARAPGDIRAQYAAALLTLASSQVNPLYGGMLSFGESGIKERVKHIMSFQRAKLLAVILCAAVAAGLALVFLTNPSAVPPTAPAPPGTEAFEPEPAASVLAVLDPAERREPEPEPGPQPRPAPSVPQPSDSQSASAPQSGAPPVVEEAAGAESGPDSREIYYNGGLVTHVLVYDRENASYHPVADPFDRLEIIYACAARETAEGKGQVVLHTEKERYSLSFDPEREPTLETLCERARREGPGVAQWLGWMNDRSLVRGSYEGAGASLTVTDRESLGRIAGFLKRLEVAPGPALLTDGTVPALNGGSAYALNLDFSTGLVYYISGDDARMVLSTSQTGELNIEYTLARPAQAKELWELMGELAREQDGLPVPEEISQLLPPAPDGIRRINLYRNADKTYVPLSQKGRRWQELSSLLRGARTAHAATLGQPLAGVSTLEVTRESDLAKLTYRLYEHGFTVEGTAVEGKSLSEAYALSSAALWELFCTTAQEGFDSAKATGVYWLGLMNEAKIEGVRVQNNATGESEEGNLASSRQVLDLLRRVTVAPYSASGIDPSQFDEGDPEAVTVFVDFTNEIRYRVSVGRDTLLITSSDMSYGLAYRLEGNGWRDQLDKLAEYFTAWPTAVPG